MLKFVRLPGVYLVNQATSAYNLGIKYSRGSALHSSIYNSFSIFNAIGPFSQVLSHMVNAVGVWSKITCHNLVVVPVLIFCLNMAYLIHGLNIK